MTSIRPSPSSFFSNPYLSMHSLPNLPGKEMLNKSFHDLSAALLAFSQWAVAHVKAILMTIGYAIQPQRLGQLSTLEVQQLTQQNFYWMTANQREILQTNYLTEKQKVQFFITEGTLNQFIMECTEKYPSIQTRLAHYLSSIKEISRLPESEAESNLQQIIKDIMQEETLPLIDKALLSHLCLQKYPFLMEQISKELKVTIPEHLLIMQFLLWGISNRPSFNWINQKELAEVESRIIENFTDDMWVCMAPQDIAAILECSFNHLKNGSKSHHQKIFKAFESCPDRLKNVISCLKNDLSLYEDFISEIFAKSNEEICDHLTAVLCGTAIPSSKYYNVAIKKEHAGMIIRWIQKVLESPAPILYRFDKSLNFLISRSISHIEIRKALLKEMSTTLRKSCDLYNQSQQMESLLDKQQDKSIAVLGNPQYVDKALVELREGKRNPFNTYMTNFVAGATVLSLCRMDSYKSYLDDLFSSENQNPKMLSILLFPCFKYINFPAGSTETYRSVLRSRLLDVERIEYLLLDELKKASPAESEALASLVFGFIRDNKTSDYLIPAFMKLFYPVERSSWGSHHPLDFSNFFKNAAYLNRNEIRMLANAWNVKGQRDGKTKIEICSGYLRTLTDLKNQKHPSLQFGDYKHPKWKDLLSELFVSLSEEEKKEVWKAYLSNATEEDVCCLLSRIDGGSPDLIRSLLDVLMISHRSIVWTLLEKHCEPLQQKNFDPIVALLFSNESMFNDLSDEIALAVSDEEQLRLMAKAMKHLTWSDKALEAGWTTKIRLKCLHKMLKELSAPQQQIFLDSFCKDIHNMLFKGNLASLEEFAERCLQQVEVQDSLPIVIKSPPLSPGLDSSKFSRHVNQIIHRQHQLKTLKKLLMIVDILDICLKFPHLFPENLVNSLLVDYNPPSSIDFEMVKVRLEQDYKQQTDALAILHQNTAMWEKTLDQKLVNLTQAIGELTESNYAEKFPPIRIQINTWGECVRKLMVTLQKEHDEEHFSSLSDIHSLLRKLHLSYSSSAGISPLIEKKSRLYETKKAATRRKLDFDTCEDDDHVELLRTNLYNAVNALKPQDEEGKKEEIGEYLNNYLITWEQIEWLDGRLHLQDTYDPGEYKTKLEQAAQGKSRRDFSSFGIKSFEDLRQAIGALKGYLSKHPTEDSELKKTRYWKTLDALVKN